MSRYRRADTPGATYFFTVVTYRRRAFMFDEDVRIALREAITKVRRQYPFQIDAWVLLPDHLHTIWTLPPGDARFSLRWQQIKRDVTLRCGERLHRVEWMSDSKIKHRESTLWQRRYWEHQIRDEADYERHMDYLHYNPVKHGLVKQARDWPYSSFHRYVEAGVYGENWAMASPMDGVGFGEKES
jgi:putative transposase